ncbi:hypothetical protein EV560_105364 [Bosea sp. BK604]|nr:hypothetical protein EV560_105364 [Bosea sp. BK604]
MMYGIIGVALFSVSAWGAVKFYNQPLLIHWQLLALGALVAFCLGVWLRKHRKQRYINASQSELIRNERRLG